MENTVSNNPLSKFFRQPAIYMKLPSGGKFWPEGSLELPVTGELPVYPMTTRDEVVLRTPDALMNGAGVVDIIQSCCPNIKDAWQMPSVDVDAVLIAIRIASYGHSMDVETECPHCKEENIHAFDLRVSLGSIHCPDYSKKLPFEQLKIKLHPQAYFGVNRENMINFEEQRLIKALEMPDVDPELRANEINASMGKLVDIALDTVTDSTEYIETDDGTVVSAKEHIRDFYQNAEGAVVKTVQRRLAEINQEGGIKPFTVPCISCEKEYQVPLTFDYANFFGKGF